MPGQNDCRQFKSLLLCLFLYIVASLCAVSPLVGCLQVTVQFRAINGEAQDMQDFSLLSREVVLSSGETSKLVPIIIVDDRIPELSETFTIELLDQITGGASLGENRTAVITIEPSDDPNGVFGEWV